MTVEIVSPASRDDWLALRKTTIGASEVAALVGRHPYPEMTRYRLWADKRGLLDGDSADTPQLRRGRHMERVGIDFLREERPDWDIDHNAMPRGRFYRDGVAGLSATPDAFVHDPTRDGFGVCQIKSVEPRVFKEKWFSDGELEPPVGIAMQAIQEAVLTGASWACVAPLVISYGIEIPIIEIPIHAGVMDRLREEAATFWEHVHSGQDASPYAPDFAVDGECIDALFAEDDGGTLDLSTIPAHAYDVLCEMLRRRELLKACEATGHAAEAERKVLDAELKFILGNAARGVLLDGRMIEAKTVRRKGFTVEPTIYRAIKVREGK